MVIIFKHIMESISHKPIHINTLIHSKKHHRHTQNREQGLLFYKFKVYYQL